MSRADSNKLKLTYLKDILTQKTNEDHLLTVSDMISELAAYGIKAERKALYNDLELLKVYGMDIQHRKGKTYGYFLGQRKFELAELKLVADAVAASKFITEKKSRELISKIESLASVHEAKQIRRQVFVHGRAKTANEKIYYNVDRIHQAISGNKQISFRYFKYDAGKKKRYQHNGELYMASPYALSWSEDNYYMVSYTGKYQNATHYRVDKMESIVLLDTPREPLPNRQTFDLGRYMARTFGMFTGEVQTVVLRCDSSMADQMLDRFGMRASIYQTEEDTFDLIADVMISPNFFRWLFGYGTKIRVISPEPVVEEYRLCLRDVARIYSGESKD